MIAHLANNELVSAREVTKRADMDKSMVSRAVARLEKSGLLRRRISKDDGRLEELALTKAGQRLFEEISPLALDYERRLASSLTAEEEADLRRLIDRLLMSNALAGIETARAES